MYNDVRQPFSAMNAANRINGAGQYPFSAMNSANRINGVGQTQVYTNVDLNRYAPGGDIYVELQRRYGTSGANMVHAASQSGDLLNITEALAQLKAGYSAQSDSTAGIFLTQLIKDPFGAPLSAANTGIGNVLGSALRGIFTNPWVLLVTVAIAAPYVWPHLKKFKQEFLSK